MQPLVSVLMPAYNAASFIKEAVESILAQSWTNFELLIYDDASTDDTVSIIESFNDKRISLYKKEKNKGYTDSLIHAVVNAKGVYIARMDSDDISDFSRLEKQVSFLEKNKDYGIVGSFVEAILPDGSKQVWNFPEEDKVIRCYLIKDSPFAHPSVMIRKEVLMNNQLNYDIHYEPCEDYKLWFELLKVTKGKNLAEPLLQYRLHENQTIVLKRELLFSNSNIIRGELFKYMFGVDLSQEELAANYKYFNEIKACGIKDIEHHYNWRKKISSVILKAGYRDTYQQFVDRYWVTHLQTLTEFKPAFIRYILDSSVLSMLSLNIAAKFFTKCMLRYKVKR